jgi:hypothetical protein
VEKKKTDTPSQTPSDPSMARLTFKPLKDIFLMGISALLIVVIVVTTFFLTPRSDDSHVEIRYDTTLLWDKNDTSKTTAIAFPTSGSHTVAFLKTDGPLYLGEGKDFDFYGDEVDVTLYADRSVRITKESSPRNVCSNLGRVYGTYTPLVCLPNRIQAMIVSDSFPIWDN